MNETDFQICKEAVICKLAGLDKNLTYHNIEHTLDVMAQCMRIASEEGVTDVKDLMHLKYASLYHDTGFLETYLEHEKKGCKIFLADVQDSDLAEEDKSVITSIIMATKLPQKPSTLLERIICDADLDYLGRDDFQLISDNLRREFLYFGMVPDEAHWHELQLNFLKTHSYHTASSQRLREPAKQRNLRTIAG